MDSQIDLFIRLKWKKIPCTKDIGFLISPKTVEVGILQPKEYNLQSDLDEVWSAKQWSSMCLVVAPETTCNWTLETRDEGAPMLLSIESKSR